MLFLVVLAGGTLAGGAALWADCSRIGDLSWDATLIGLFAASSTSLGFAASLPFARSGRPGLGIVLAVTLAGVYGALAFAAVADSGIPCASEH